MSDAHYVEPHESEPCMRCRHLRYNSSLDELWCSHTPPPQGLGPRSQIGKWGHCEYWEDDDE